MSKTLKNVAGLALAAIAAGASAAPITLTFDTPFNVPVQSYTENGLTITAAPNSTSLVEISSEWDVFGWNVPCCPGGTDIFDLTTGGLFTLNSIEVLHTDGGDPIVAEGFLRGSPIASASFGNGLTGLFAFVGFGSVDLVRFTASGLYSDATFDNLTYTPNVVPLPATAWLLLAGIGGLALQRFRRSVAARASRDRHA